MSSIGFNLANDSSFTLAEREIIIDIDSVSSNATVGILSRHLVFILEDDPLAPKGNVMARNICWRGPWGRTQREAEPLVKFEDNLIDVDPRFAGSPPADFRLADDSPAHRIGFQPIPLDKIGVYESDDRASWPIEHALRRDPRVLPESEPHE